MLIRKTFRKVQEEEGFVLITSMMIMMMVVMLGVMATNTSTIEVQIAGIDKFHQIAFFGGDSGIYTTPKLIGQALNDMQTPVNPNIENISTTFYDEVKGNITPAVPDEEAGIAHQLEFGVGGELPNNGPRTGEFAEVFVDVRKMGADNNVGGGVESHTGAEGVGASGEPPILYQLDSKGVGARNSSASIIAVYRRINNTSGGL